MFCGSPIHAVEIAQVAGSIAAAGGVSATCCAFFPACRHQLARLGRFLRNLWK